MNSFTTSAFAVALAACFAATASGCSGIPVTDEGTMTTHHIILGFGIVTTSDPAAAERIAATRIHAIGIVADTGPAGGVALGYKSATTVQADANSDSFVEIAPGAFGPMRVTTSISHNDSHENP